jgi:hypothetical protein
MAEKTKMLGRYDPLVVVGMIQMQRKLALPTEVELYPAIQKQVITILVFVAQALTSKAFNS